MSTDAKTRKKATRKAAVKPPSKPSDSSESFQAQKLPAPYTLGPWGKVFITLAGYEDQVPIQYQDQNVVGLHPDHSILHWMLSVPATVELELLKPPGINAIFWQTFESLIEGALLSRNLSFVAVQHGASHWLENAIVNFETLKSAHSVNALPKAETEEDYAYILGNGPSLKHFLQRETFPEGKFFTCWHALSKVIAAGQQPDFITHIDPFPFTELDTFNETPAASVENSVPVITAPSSHPDFLKRFSGHPFYLYLGQDRLVNACYAHLLGLGDHPHVVGNIGHMMVRLALLLGYKKVVLAGIDMAADTPDDYIFNSAGARPVEGVNRHGKTYYTHQAFLGHAGGFEKLVSEHPDARFYNASTVGLDFERYEAF